MASKYGVFIVVACDLWSHDTTLEPRSHCLMVHARGQCQMAKVAAAMIKRCVCHRCQCAGRKAWNETSTWADIDRMSKRMNYLNCGDTWHASERSVAASEGRSSSRALVWEPWVQLLAKASFHAQVLLSRESLHDRCVMLDSPRLQIKVSAHGCECTHYIVVRISLNSRHFVSKFPSYCTYNNLKAEKEILCSYVTERMRF
jgi:hypothetical protein